MVVSYLPISLSTTSSPDEANSPIHEEQAKKFVES